MASSDSEYIPEDEDAVVQRRKATVPRLEFVKQGFSRSPSLEVSSPKREATDDLGDQEQVVKRRRTDRKLSQANVAEYTQLLEDDIQSFFHNTSDLDVGSEIVDTQYGAVHWSTVEKAKLFHTLGRKGRHDLLALSQAVESKSEPEVADYLRLLEDGYKNRHLKAEKVDLCRYVTFPASADIGERLRSALEEAADQVLLKEYKEARSRALYTYGETGILTSEAAERLANDPMLEVGNAQMTRGSFEFANTLLNLPRMLSLSASVFMNSSDAEQHWTSLDTSGDGPSIFRDAFVDFCKLVVSLTERIVSAAHFLALSRLRAMGSKVQRPLIQEVKRSDVLAALDILNLPLDSWNFWVACPRKCQLEVINDRNPPGKVIELGYDEAEKLLSDPNGLETDVLPSIEVHPEQNVDGKPQSDIEEFTSESESSDQQTRGGLETRSGSEGAIRPMSVRSRSVISNDVHDLETDAEDKEDIEEPLIESADLERSRLEEAKLWRILGSGPTSENDEQKAIEHKRLGADQKVKFGRSERKTAAELDDWRDMCRFESQWERYPQPIGNLSLPAGELALQRGQTNDDDASVSLPDAESRHSKDQDEASDLFVGENELGGSNSVE